MTDAPAVGILADVHRGVGRILLNRPKALNALTTDMVAAIDRVLSGWERTPLSAVVLASTSTKAFCRRRRHPHDPRAQPGRGRRGQ